MAAYAITMTVTAAVYRHMWRVAEEKDPRFYLPLISSMRKRVGWLFLGAVLQDLDDLPYRVLSAMRRILEDRAADMEERVDGAGI